MILIDASAFIEFLNRTGSRADVLIEQLIRDDGEVALADVTLTEILQGIKNDREFREVKAALLTFPILSLRTPESFAAAAELYCKCRRRGFTVRSTIDLLIAQTALEHRATLLHNDRDFDAIAKVCDLQIMPANHA